MDWNTAYATHYEQYFQAPIGLRTFQQEPLAPVIHVQEYENIFPGCRAYCSLGLNLYESVVGKIAEVCLVSDGGFDVCAEILANALFFLIKEKMLIDRGMSIGGVESINPEFVKDFEKTTLYFDIPISFPDQFQHVQAGRRGQGDIYLAFFITENERKYFKERGADAFETLLEEQSVDIFDVKRKSVV